RMVVPFARVTGRRRPMVIPFGSAPTSSRRQDMAATAPSDLKRARVDLRDIKGPPAPKEALRSLPATVDWLRRSGLLMESDVEVDGDLQLTGIQKHFDGSYPILFNRVKGYPHARAITNLFA